MLYLEVKWISAWIIGTVPSSSENFLFLLSLSATECRVICNRMIVYFLSFLFLSFLVIPHNSRWHSIPQKVWKANEHYTGKNTDSYTMYPGKSHFHSKWNLTTAHIFHFIFPMIPTIRSNLVEYINSAFKWPMNDFSAQFTQPLKPDNSWRN